MVHRAMQWNEVEEKRVAEAQEKVMIEESELALNPKPPPRH